MKTVWHIRGPKAATFEQLSDQKAAALVKAGKAQICDGSPLAYPETHPDYVAPKEEAAGTGEKYSNKMQTTDAS